MYILTTLEFPKHNHDFHLRDIKPWTQEYLISLANH